MDVSWSLISNSAVYIKGGLGNQLFQIAFAMHLREFYKQNVHLDMSWFDKPYANRKFEAELLCSDFSRINSPWFRFALEKVNAIVSESDFKDSEVKRKFVLFDGYFQDRTYAKYLLHKLLSLSSAIDQNLLNRQAIGIHIRRGDYLKTEVANHHGLCSMDYYKDASDVLKNKLGDLPICVYSDSPGEISSNLPKEWHLMKSPTSALSCLLEMSNYKGLVISNSSFSWWSAYVGSNRANPTSVVYPFPWLASKSSRDDLLPASEWIMLKKNSM
jgi:hypothetical protein